MAGTHTQSYRQLPVSRFDPWQVVATLAPALRIAHHLPGRIRFKLDTAVLGGNTLHELGAKGLSETLGRIRGVHDVKLNLLARSCLVEYDAAIIPDVAWPDLLAGRQTEAAQTLMTILQEKYEEIRDGEL